MHILPLIAPQLLLKFASLKLGTSAHPNVPSIWRMFWFVKPLQPFLDICVNLVGIPSVLIHRPPNTQKEVFIKNIIRKKNTMELN